MKVLLILVDGMRPDAIVELPQVKKILKKSAYTLKGTTVNPSVTLPCHMSLFHSVDPARHGITTNLYMPQVRPINGICEVLDQNAKQCAMFYGWGELRDLCRPSSNVFSYFCAGRYIGREAMNNQITEAVIKYLAETDTEFTFLYYGYTDWAGHEYGWMSDGYMEAMRNSWENIERVVESLHGDYTVFITADHGGHDRTHGTEMPEDMIIPIIAMGKDFAPGTQFAEANIKDIAPTITKVMGVAPDREWEGKSLI